MGAATDAFFEETADGGFDHQRDAYEAGYERGVLAERVRIRTEIDRRRERYWQGQPDGYVWFDDLYNLTAPKQRES
jgi:hypothetical protein